MKGIRLSLIAIFSIVATALLVSSCTTPADYLDGIMTRCTQIEKNINKFIDQLSSNDLSNIQEKYAENVAEIDKTIEYMQNVGSCDNKDYLQKAGLSFAQKYKEVYETELAKAVESVTANGPMEASKVTSLLESVDDKTKKVRSDLINNFTQFLKDFDITVNTNF
ncbi:MAG: hypothetical protein IK017_00875 [Paludibacteraceae bacterium]|nr:hypothetical protein [Paludibacteraceae bacterium]MBR5971189.1 hypothetical protein [Paludibacteraceae bacterium]